MENIVYQFFRQLWLTLKVKLMEINSCGCFPGRCMKPWLRNHMTYQLAEDLDHFHNGMLFFDPMAAVASFVKDTWCFLFIICIGVPEGMISSMKYNS